MAQLLAGYTNLSRAISTDFEGYGSTLLGQVKGAVSRAVLASQVLDHVQVTPTLIDVTMKDGSKLYASGSYGATFETNSFSTFLSQISGTMDQIVEIESITPGVPRYTLSNVSINVQDYFSTTDWIDVLQGNDTLTGGPGGDDLIDYGGHSVFKGMGGYDNLMARENDQNLAIYRGNLEQYQISFSDAINIGDQFGVSGVIVNDLVNNRDGLDNLVNIERLQFSDTMVGLDVGKGEHTGEVYRLYLTVLGRNPESDPVGCGFWIDKLDRGILNVEQMVGNFLNSTEFVTRFGGTTNTNESFVNLMYLNLLGRDGHPDSGFTFWLNVLNNHQASREQVVAGFMESPENISNAAPLIGDTPTYQQWAG